MVLTEVGPVGIAVPLSLVVLYALSKVEGSGTARASAMMG